MSSKNPEQLIAGYVPVIHRGYLELFDRYPEAHIGVLDGDVIDEIDYLRKDIRALSPEQAVAAVNGLGRPASLLSMKALSEAFQTPETAIIMPDDDVSRQLLATHDFPSKKATLEPVFLRWDRENVKVNVDVRPDATIEAHQLNPRILEQLEIEASHSTNWWRHIGAVLTKNEEIVASSRNQTLPSDYSLYIDSDPRITTKRGENIDVSLDIHAESKLIAEMAKKGVALEGSELYVSTFPCPNCAKLIATSGIKTCYFVEGYAMLDGFDVLKSADVEIVKINAEIESDGSSIVLPYPTSSRS
ncbi:MAG: deaminase [Candidatus Microsaccharimonas sp.]